MQYLMYASKIAKKRIGTMILTAHNSTAPPSVLVYPKYQYFSEKLIQLMLFLND